MSFDIRKPAHGTTIHDDWDKATAFLLKENYFCETIYTPSTNSTALTRGLVFAHPSRLSVLSKRGYLTLFDSTHKVNVHGYNLFTFLCRNEYGIWIPGANCLVESENSDVLAEAMKCIYRWSQNRWQMRYPLTDNSAIEKAAVRKAFGESVENHILCTVHTERTLQRNFKSLENQESYGLLRHAMNAHTEEHCLSLCQKAIEKASSERKKNYIQKELIENRNQWALFARQHCQILMQVTSTNACEAWHSRLKNGAVQKKGETSTHGIFGCVRTVHDCAHEVENKVKLAEIESNTKQVLLIKRPGYEGLHLFPYSLQRIVATEYSKLAIRLEQQMPVPVREWNPSTGLYDCNCLFSRRYQLSCQHICHINHDFRVNNPGPVEFVVPPLTTEVWGKYHQRFGSG